MSKASITTTPSPQVLTVPPDVSLENQSGFITLTPGSQGKLKRMQDNDVDLEAGMSKKKILMSGSSSQQESQAQPTSQQATGEKPSFRVIGHFVMAMKRFQGEQQYKIPHNPAPSTVTPSPTCCPGVCSINQSNIHVRQSCRRQWSI